MTAPWRTWARPAVGVAILAVLVWRLGTGPFLDGLRRVDGWSLLAATAIALVTTVCCAWRWCIVARGLDVAVPLRSAVTAYYLSQFLNTTLPGGVLGDVDRAVRHGRTAGSTGRGLRAVAWERFAGLLVAVVVLVGLLVLLPSPVQSSVPVVLAVVGVAVLGLVLLARTLPARSWTGVVLASTVAVCGHLLTFLVAARTAGLTVSVTQLVPLAVVVLLAMAVPLSLAGWGPREGAAAWAFGAAGLGAEQGVAVAVVYGVIVFVATLPGAAVLLVHLWGRRR